MKLIIEIPEEVYDWIRDKYENPNEEIVYDSVKKGIPYKEVPQGDLISREALRKAVEEEGQYLLARGQGGAEHILVHHCLRFIYDAPTVPLPDFKEGYKQAILDGKTNFSRPQGEWRLDMLGPYCSECGVHPDYSSNFCPNCGASMKGCAEE